MSINYVNTKDSVSVPLPGLSPSCTLLQQSFISDFGKNIKAILVEFVNDRESRKDNDVFSDKIKIQKVLAC